MLLPQVGADPSLQPPNVLPMAMVDLHSGLSRLQEVLTAVDPRQVWVRPGPGAPDVSTYFSGLDLLPPKDLITWFGAVGSIETAPPTTEMGKLPARLPLSDPLLPLEVAGYWWLSIAHSLFADGLGGEDWKYLDVDPRGFFLVAGREPVLRLVSCGSPYSKSPVLLDGGHPDYARVDWDGMDLQLARLSRDAPTLGALAEVLANKLAEGLEDLSVGVRQPEWERDSPPAGIHPILLRLSRALDDAPQVLFAWSWQGMYEPTSLTAATGYIRLSPTIDVAHWYWAVGGLRDTGVQHIPGIRLLTASAAVFERAVGVHRLDPPAGGRTRTMSELPSWLPLACLTDADTGDDAGYAVVPVRRLPLIPSDALPSVVERSDLPFQHLPEVGDSTPVLRYTGAGNPEPFRIHGEPTTIHTFAEHLTQVLQRGGTAQSEL